MTKRILSKSSWKDAIGATKKPKRLKLVSHNGLLLCPVAHCESNLIEVNVVVETYFRKTWLVLLLSRKARHCQSFS